MKQYVLVMVAVLSAGLCAAALETAHVPADAQWVFHMDCEVFAAGYLGQRVVADVQDRYQSKIEAKTRYLGSDLTRDIHGVTLFGVGNDEADAVMLVYGQFDRGRLLELLQRDEAYDTTIHRDRVLHHWHDRRRSKDQVGAFAADDVIVISQSVERIQDALDVIDGQKDPLAERPDAPLRALVDSTRGAFLVAAADDVSTLVRGTEHAAVLQNSRTLSITADEVNDVFRLNVYLEAKSEQAAQQVEQLARGMLAYAALQQDNFPELAPLTEAFSLTRTDALLAFEFNFPSDELLGMIYRYIGK